jgi:hypothetical protein
MVTYPIYIQREHYSGRDAKRRLKVSDKNRIASELETYINNLLLKQDVPIQVYDFADIARATRYSLDVVSELGFSIDCGSNGFTAWKHDMTQEAAIAANNAYRNLG